MPNNYFWVTHNRISQRKPSIWSPIKEPWNPQGAIAISPLYLLKSQQAGPMVPMERHWNRHAIAWWVYAPYTQSDSIYATLELASLPKKFIFFLISSGRLILEIRRLSKWMRNWKLMHSESDITPLLAEKLLILVIFNGHLANRKFSHQSICH